jgi:hypothetical protein
VRNVIVAPSEQPTNVHEWERKLVQVVFARPAITSAAPHKRIQGPGQIAIAHEGCVM